MRVLLPPPSTKESETPTVAFLYSILELFFSIDPYTAAGAKAGTDHIQIGKGPEVFF